MVLSFPEGCLETLERGERLAEQLGHDPSLVQAYNFISMCHMFKGNGVQAAQYGEKALNTARKLGTLEVVVPTVASLCTAYSRSFHFTRIQEIAPDALEQLEKAGRLHDFFGQTGARYPVLCAIYGYALGGLGEFERGEGFCAKGIEEARRLGNLQTLALAEAYVNLFHLTRADGPTMEAHSRQLIELGQRAKWDQLMGYGQILMGCALALLGNPAGAIEAERTGMALVRKANVEHLLSMGCHCLATSLLTLGRNEEAAAAVREGLQLAKKCGETGHEGVLLIDLGRCHAEVASSAADEAEASMKAGIQILESLKVSPWYSQGYLHLGRLYAARDRKDAAREWLRKADANFRRMGMNHWVGRTEEVLESVA
jgi:tetratricopeptide (TPR) repeat protein